jgi:magnesium transporter
MNTVMKFLTSITIVVSLPTIIASFYGMNVTLPLQNNPFAFMITLLIAFVVMIGVAVVFWKRDWL